jgi:hypothetical protein
MTGVRWVEQKTIARRKREKYCAYQLEMKPADTVKAAAVVKP